MDHKDIRNKINLWNDYLLLELFRVFVDSRYNFTYTNFSVMHNLTKYCRPPENAKYGSFPRIKSKLSIRPKLKYESGRICLTTRNIPTSHSNHFIIKPKMQIYSRKFGILTGSVRKIEYALLDSRRVDRKAMIDFNIRILRTGSWLWLYLLISIARYSKVFGAPLLHANMKYFPMYFGWHVQPDN